MNEAQRAQYTETGYLHLKGVLSPRELEQLNEVYTQRLLAELGDERFVPGRHSFETQTTSDDGRVGAPRRFWSPAFANLLNHKATTPIVRELLCDARYGHVPHPMPPHRGRITLDHDNIHYHPPARDSSDTGGALHSPRLDKNPVKAVCRLITVVFELASVGPGDGGFGCLAGSHDSSYALPVSPSLPPSLPWPSLPPSLPAPPCLPPPLSF